MPMKVLITEKLSEHRYKTPEGYLVCVDAILARTGPQVYKHNQVYDCSTDEITDVEVDRKPEQVFSPQAIASFENKPLTIQHPNEPVTIANHKALYHGFARDIRRAVKRNGQILTGSKRPSTLQADDQEVLVGNIIVTTSDAIEEIDNGLEFLSCGYDCDITQTDKPEQINIRGNHIALCDNPRAGITMLQDNAEPFVQHFIKVLTDALDKSTIEINKIEGGKADKLSIEEIAKKHNVSINEIVEQLIKGIDVEFEHTNDKNKAKEIAMDHLVEMPDYYTKLAKMESQDAINYIVMCEQLYNGITVRSRQPWRVFTTPDKEKAQKYIQKKNDEVKTLVGFSLHYYLG